jgi:hypothetical protein
MRYLIFIILIVITNNAEARVICENGFVEKGASEQEVRKKCETNKTMGGSFNIETSKNEKELVNYRVITKNFKNGDVISFVLIKNKLEIIIK